MAEQVIRRQVDDLERLRGNLDVVADETVIFGLDGQSLVIDLSKDNAEALRKSLADYVAAARPLIDQEARKELSPAQAKRAELDDVRRWAVRQGYPVNRRGRIPQTVLDGYQLANGPLKHQQ